jgi:hypothetical protein
MIGFCPPETESCGLGVTLKPKQERSSDLNTLNNEFRDRLQTVAGIRVYFTVNHAISGNHIRELSNNLIDLM